jgi:menaquinone-dependent protoporphyrinogen oxidase
MGAKHVLVTYGSKRGSTAELAAWLGDALTAEGLGVDVLPVREARDLEGYDAVVLGGALYANRWYRTARRFARRRRRQLRERAVWLFSSGPLDDSATERDIPPTKSVAATMTSLGARGHQTFGGSLRPDVSGFIASKVAAKAGGDHRDPAQVRAWAHTIATELAGAVTPG